MTEESNMIRWIKPNGAKVETNDDPANIQAAKNMGWKRAQGRPPKED